MEKDEGGIETERRMGRRRTTSTQLVTTCLSSRVAGLFSSYLRKPEPFPCILCRFESLLSNAGDILNVRCTCTHYLPARYSISLDCLFVARTPFLSYFRRASIHVSIYILLSSGRSAPLPVLQPVSLVRPSRNFVPVPFSHSVSLDATYNLPRYWLLSARKSRETRSQSTSFDDILGKLLLGILCNPVAPKCCCRRRVIVIICSTVSCSWNFVSWTSIDRVDFVRLSEYTTSRKYFPMLMGAYSEYIVYDI